MNVVRRDPTTVGEGSRDGRDRAHSLNSPLSASHLVPDPFHRVATRGHFPRSIHSLRLPAIASTRSLRSLVTAARRSDNE